MAIPSTRATFKEYCLRSLGKPVIEINVDPDQVEDRIDEALQYFSQYHYDGIERIYLKYQITQADIDRARSDNSLPTATDVDGATTAVWKEQKNYSCSLYSYVCS
jgi:hypothetical protein